MNNMDKKVLAIKAIDKLRQIKGVPICLADFTYDTSAISNSPCYVIRLYQDYVGETYELTIDDTLFTDPARARDPDEPTHLSWDELIIIRLAKLIYNDYKTRSWNTNLNGVSINAGTFTNTLNASSINLGNMTLSSNTITDLEDKVKDLEQTLEDTKNDKDNLMIKVIELETLLKAKGVI